MTVTGQLLKNIGMLEIDRRLNDAYRRLQVVAWDDESFRELLMCWTSQREEILLGLLEC